MVTTNHTTVARLNLQNRARSSPRDVRNLTSMATDQNPPLDVQLQEMDQKFSERLDRIAEHVESMAEFMGKAAEMEVATQHKLDRVSEDIRELTQAIRHQETVIAGYQKTTQDLIQLATLMMQQKAS